MVLPLLGNVYSNAQVRASEGGGVEIPVSRFSGGAFSLVPRNVCRTTRGCA